MITIFLVKKITIKKLVYKFLKKNGNSLENDHHFFNENYYHKILVYKFLKKNGNSLENDHHLFSENYHH